MPVIEADVIRVELSDDEIHELVMQANNLALRIIDRKDLHERDHLERVINVALGEIAEYMVIKWLQSNGKSAKSSVDKKSGEADAGHDLIALSRRTKDEIQCSVKSSLSFAKDLRGIINEFRLATKRSELRTVNIQVYFWLELYREPRVTVPSTGNAAIIGWFTRQEVEAGGFISYTTENREAPNVLLRDARTMQSLLNLID